MYERHKTLSICNVIYRTIFIVVGSHKHATMIWDLNRKNKMVRQSLRLCLQFYDSRYIDIRTGEIATGKELFNGRINRNHKKDSENLHRYRGKRTYAGHRALLRKKVNLNPGDLVSLNGEVLIVHGTHTNKKGAVNVEFKTPGKSGQKSASLKKLKIVKAADSIHPAWEKVS